MAHKVKLTEEESIRQQQGRRVREMCQTEGWQQVVFPILESAIKSAVVDPRKFQSDSEYAYAQKLAWAYGQAYSDLLDRFDNMVKDSEFLTEKEQGKHQDKLRESLS